MTSQQIEKENEDEATERLAESLFTRGLSDETHKVLEFNFKRAKIRHSLNLVGDDEKVSLGRMYAVQLRKSFEKKTLVGDKYEVTHHVTSYGWELLRQMESDPIYSYSKIPFDLIEQYRETRIKLIRSLIARNVPVPEIVMAQYPEGFFDRDFEAKTRERKARWTAGANRTGREDDSLYADYGIMMRRQDGRQVRVKERDQLKSGLDEIIEIFPDLTELCRIKSLTIIHTGGKSIFQSPRDILGVYNNTHKTISVGVAGQDGEPDIRALSHELVGHWLDYISVPEARILEQTFGAEISFLQEEVTASYLDTLAQGHLSCFYAATLSMNPVEKKNMKSFAFAHPTEVFARLVEQYIATWLYMNGNKTPISVFPLAFLIDQPAYWSADDWSTWLMEEAKIQIDARWELARLVNSLPINKPDDRIWHPYFLPWSVGKSDKQIEINEIIQ